MSLSSAQSHLSSRSAGRGPRCGAGRPSRGRPVRATTRAVEVAPGPRPRILVIEDDPSVLPFIAACLTRSGYEVVGCQRGDEGLLAALGGQWALVILDLVLPGLPGLDVLRGIAGAHSRVPVMIATGHGTEEAIIAALRLGAVDFLKKPIRVVDLVESVAAAVRRRVHWSLEPTSSQSMRNPDGPPAQVELLDDLSCLSPGNLVLANRRLGVEAALLALAVHHLTTIPVFTAAATAFKELREATPVDAPVLAAAAARRLRLAWAQKFHGHRSTRAAVEIWEAIGRNGAKLSVSSVAAQVGVAPSTLSHQVAAETGLLPHQWQIGGVVRFGVRLLSVGRMPLKEIAWFLGYPQESSFTRHVHQFFGMPPSSLVDELGRFSRADHI